MKKGSVQDRTFLQLKLILLMFKLSAAEKQGRCTLLSETDYNIFSGKVKSCPQVVCVKYSLVLSLMILKACFYFSFFIGVTGMTPFGNTSLLLSALHP